ncbi:MAG: hypothetical protein IJ033_04665 [Clostridia bacterium]|nr:hypothetical protein [Clostridia bacterium]
MLVSMIILGILALMIIVGLGRPILKDLKMSWIIPLVFFAVVIGLNFIPIINLGAFSFSVGTLVFYIGIFVTFFIFSRLSSSITAMGLGLIAGGLIYAATRISYLTGNEFFATTNWVYALVLGILMFAITRNGKYSFLASVIAMLLSNMLVQIGSDTVSLNYNFGWTMLASGVAFTLHAVSYLIMEKWLPHTNMKDSRLAHMFESGRLED